MSALLFGSISTVADTSELQRNAFNRAFVEHDLDWQWSREQYRSMLAAIGGQDRIAEYARTTGQTVDAAAVYRSKSDLFHASLTPTVVTPRPGVVASIRDAEEAGTKVGFVTCTSPENISSLLAALSPELSSDDFDLIVDASVVQARKPDAAAYTYALDVLRERPEDCVAIEDNLGGLQAATAAGLRCVAFPNANTATQHFPTAHERVTALDPAQLRALVAADEAPAPRARPRHLP